MTGRSSHAAFDPLLGESQAVQRLRQVINTLSPLNTTVLLYGEPGTEKQTVARMIHDKNPAAWGKFIPVHLSAIPSSLLQGALFGHEEGAGQRSQPGYFERAENGTLFLQDIGDLDRLTQVRLLQILQDGQYVRAGGTEVLTAQTRIVVATSQNLKKLVQNGEFRQDLYYRLNFITVEIPPLRERSEDIPMLARHFVQKLSMRHDIRGASLSPEVIALLKSYHWPGNLHQLENSIQKLITPAKPPLPHSDDLLLERKTLATGKMQCDEFLPFAEVRDLFDHDRFQQLLRRTQDRFTAHRQGWTGQNPARSADDLLYNLQQRYNARGSETDNYN
ncbi:sigma-54-dependent Fis family transcriptional regulator [candidate division KSB1 bacterium]|nr:sigma-54-dependent Fis family transcriptional regulator [candidate division KSB1 bacterium]